MRLRKYRIGGFPKIVIVRKAVKIKACMVKEVVASLSPLGFARFYSYKLFSSIKVCA